MHTTESASKIKLYKNIRIPMAGMMDSLNVSVSAAILAFEAVRQRNDKKGV